MEEAEKITLKKWEEKDLHKRTNLWPSPLEIERKNAKRSRTTSRNRMIQLKQIDKISIINDEQSERLKSALYLRLKKRKMFKICSRRATPAWWKCNLLLSVVQMLCYTYLLMRNMKSYKKIYGCAQLYVLLYLIPAPWVWVIHLFVYLWASSSRVR